MISSKTPEAMQKKLEGKVAVITGGASGIGASTAKLFISHGAKVVITDIEDELGRTLIAELGLDVASFIHCDVTDEDQVSAAVDFAVAQYGTLDIMFNNAGIAGSQTSSILEDTKAEFEQVMGVNVIGPFLGTKHAARVMIPARRGTIINTSSMASVVCGVVSRHAYTSSKHAVVGLTQNSAVELGQFGIRVNCVSPSAVATPLALQCLGGMSAQVFEMIACSMANLKGVAALKAEDVANAVLYLASDDARYVSGHNLVVDGGFSIVNPSVPQLGAADYS